MINAEGIFMFVFSLYGFSFASSTSLSTYETHSRKIRFVQRHRPFFMVMINHRGSEYCTHVNVATKRNEKEDENLYSN